MNKKTEAPAEKEEQRAAFDHKEGVYSEPKVGDDPKVRRHDVEPTRNPAEFEELGNGPVPRRADPYAAQRDKKAAEKSVKEDSKK